MTFFTPRLVLGVLSLCCIADINGIQASSAIVNNNELAIQHSLKYWDQVVSQLTTQSPLFDRGEDRLRAYLYHAQKNFVEACLAKTGFYPQNVDSISLHIIQLFYPSYQSTVQHDTHLEQFRLRLQSTIDQRFKNEKIAIHHPISLQIPEKGWKGKKPYHGLEILNWKPWVLPSASEFRIPPPPLPSASSFWQHQLHEIKEEMVKVTPSQKKRILFWANMTGIGSGDWVCILNQYMKQAHIPLMIQLKARNAIGKTIVDASIAAFDSKYTYLVRRPNMLDSNLKTYIDTPNHPSFPSAHSTVSFAILEILNYYFPENQSEWQRLAEEAGMSRIWAGIHFPIDHDEGKKLGKKIGQVILKNILVKTSYR